MSPKIVDADFRRGQREVVSKGWLGALGFCLFVNRLHVWGYCFLGSGLLAQLGQHVSARTAVLTVL